MSTNANLPAGFFITSINNIRCTAVPRSATVLTGSAASVAATLPNGPGSSTSSSVQSSIASSTQVQSSVNLATSTLAKSTSLSTAVASTAVVVSSAPPEVTSTTAAPPVPPAPPAVIIATTPDAQPSAAAISSTSTSTSSDSSSSSISSAASPASKGTTPTTSSTTPIAVAQSEVRSSTTATSVFNSDNGFQSLAMSIPPATATSAAPSSTESATGGGISSNPRLTPAPVVGGVLGSMGLIAGVALLFFFLRKRKRGRRNSLLTPLTTGNRSEFSRYEIDRNSVGPTKFSEKWRSDVGSQRDRLRAATSGLKTGVLGIGASLKSKVVRDRSGTPSVNLDRGNSQFLDGPIPQHSRNNSVLSNGTGKPTFKEKFNDLWERVTDKIKFRKNNELADPFAAARGMTEKQASLNNPPDFSQLLGMDDRKLQLQAERRRASLTKTQSDSSLPPLGSLGLNFGDDPFADPITAANTSANKSQAWKPQQPGRPRNNTDPFADPISQPQPSIPKQNTYVQDIRRSRGQSVDATNTGPSMYGRPPSTVAATSRYPSTIAPSRDSYRDTVFSSFSANGRKGKGRSDPFDLERPELWRNGGNVLSGNRGSTRPRVASISGRESSNLYPNPLTMNNLRQNEGLPPPRVVSNVPPTARVMSNDTYGSKYSSGISSLGGWGDPGPDLGPGSGNSSLRGNASSSGGSVDLSANGAQGKNAGGWSRQQELARQGDGNVSPVSFESKASSRGGVGKAM